MSLFCKHDDNNKKCYWCRPRNLNHEDNNKCCDCVFCFIKVFRIKKAEQGEEKKKDQEHQSAKNFADWRIEADSLIPAILHEKACFAEEFLFNN